MKITIEISPEESAVFLSELIKGSVNNIREAEERIASMLINVPQQKKKKKEIAEGEVPSGGYYH
jgi:hypothetical protein